MPSAPEATPLILANGRLIGGVSTQIARLGGYDLTIATTVGELALDVQTTVLGHPATATIVSWIVRSRELAQAGSEKLPGGGLADTTSVTSRVLEHCARLRVAVEEITGAQVTLEIDDQELAALLHIPPDTA